MKKIFLDTNYLMDLLARGPEYSVPAKKALEMIRFHDCEVFISFLSVANLAYILRKESRNELINNINLVCKLFKIIPNTRSHLIEATEIETRDYEDAIQYSTALSADCDCIITRNEKDFKFSRIPIFSPQEYIEIYGE